jgi:hypothetical protein
MEVLFGNAVELAHVSFGFVPKVLVSLPFGAMPLI